MAYDEPCTTGSTTTVNDATVSIPAVNARTPSASIISTATACTHPASEKAAHAAPSTGLTPLVTLDIALRGLLELGIVLALGIWGYRTGSTVTMELLLAIAAPVLGFGFWGAVDFHQAGRLAEPLRLLQELAISALAGTALFYAGFPVWGLTLLALSAVHHALVYALGQRLIENRKS